MDDDDFDSKLVGEINYISHVEIKEEVIIPDDPNDSESTLSDSEKGTEAKSEECTICCKYRSMFIILKNHDCQPGEEDGKCGFCMEISQWSNCYKNHRESHEWEREADSSSDSTASDREENEEKCKICLKYEFMVPLLKSHVCRVTDKKCRDCIEVLHWTVCYKAHAESHLAKDAADKAKEENSSDSTSSDNEEIQKFLCRKGKGDGREKCVVCLKYEVMLMILEENHACEVEEKCEKCEEIQHWHKCFESHKNSHLEKSCSEGIKESANNCVRHFDGKSDCGICLKLNSIVTKLVKNHSCYSMKSCSVCQEVSYWLSCLKHHKESDLNDTTDGEEVENVKNWRNLDNCAVCAKIRFAIVNLEGHVCRRQKGRHKCEVCREISFWLRNYKRHKSNHSNHVVPVKNFSSCSACGKRFSSEKMLKVHKSYCKNLYLSQEIYSR